VATLCLDRLSEYDSRLELQRWLAGDWALLFSNPEDFELPGYRRSRRLAHLRQDFQMRGLRALAVRIGGAPTPGWVDELHSDSQIVRLSEPAVEAADDGSTAARLLREDLLTTATSFVLFIDGTLRRQDVLRYSAGRDSVSLSDLLVTVDALRSRRSFDRGWLEQPPSRYGNAPS
jgi:alkyl hydroperoxide reductase subunit AhpC